MGSGGSKSKDKKGKAAPPEGADQQQQSHEEEQRAAEKTVGEPQQRQPQVELPATVEGERMSEEFVEAVVAKASEFGDNE